MCHAISANGGRFDPRLCPLLAGLPPDEQEERMRDDPRIRACIDTMAGKAASTPTVSKMVSAYERCAHDAQCINGSDNPASLVDAG